MAIPQTVNTFLEDLNVDFEIINHPASYSSKETARRAHIDEDHIAKAVIVKDKEGYAMVVLPANENIKMHTLQKEMNRDFRLATETEIKKLLNDCETGAIPAIGQAYGLETYLDEQLTSLANIYFEAGDHENLVHINGDEFHQIFRGVRHGHFCH